MKECEFCECYTCRKGCNRCSDCAYSKSPDDRTIVKNCENFEKQTECDLCLCYKCKHNNFYKRCNICFNLLKELKGIIKCNAFSYEKNTVTQTMINIGHKNIINKQQEK